MNWKLLQRFGLFTVPSFALILSSGIFSISHAQTVTTNAYDNASNYPSNTWTNGANGGTGFQPWVLTSGNGTGGFGGNFVGNPSAAGITGMSSNSFAQYANPSGSGAYANAERVFSSALAVGQTLSFQWGINFDSGNGILASKGVVFSAGGNEISSLNLNNAGSSAITIGGAGVGFGYGTNVMTWAFTRTGDKLYKVVANDRDGNGVYSNNIAVSNGTMDKIKFYAYNMQAGDQAQPYFNELTIFTTDTDNVAPSIALAQGVERVTWVAKSSAFSPSTSDVTATDGSGAANVTFDPSTVDTTVDGLTKLTYTATDPTGNTASVVRVVAVGDASPGWRKLHYPKSATISSLSSLTAYGRIYIDGATSESGQAPNITAELGVNTVDSDPSSWTGTGVWRAATYNAGFTGGDDEYESTINGAELTAGTYYYVYRFKIGSGAWQYAGISAAGTNGGPWNGTTSMSGVLTVEGARTLTFMVNMNGQINKLLFNPTTQGVEVRGGFNAWAGGAATLADDNSDGIYTGSFTVAGDLGGPVVYKFYRTGISGAGYEDLANNRTLTLGADGVSSTIATALFNNDDGVGPVISIIGDNPLNLNVGGAYTDPGATANDAIEGNRLVTTSGTVNSAVAGTYTVTYNASDANGNAGTAVTRSVVVAAVGSTFAGAYPSQSLTGLAPNGLSYLANYAFGGNSTTQATLPVQDTSDPTKLRLIVIYRTDDATLPLNALGGETTAELAGVWSASGVSVEDSTDSSPAPANTVRKVISVDRGTDPKKFLRATVTK